MKTTFKIILFVLILFSGMSKPQSLPSKDDLSSKIQSGWGNLNYAVPESPAFKILGVSPDNMLRPTSTRDIGISIGNYYVDNGSTIPKNLSVEIAPSLFNPSVNLNDYQNYGTRLWYTSTISVGTEVNQNGSFDIGIGINLKLIDRGDLRTNRSFISFLDKIGLQINNAYSEAMYKEGLKIKKERKIPNLSDARIIAESDYNNQKDPVYSEINEEMHKNLSYEDFVQKLSNCRDSIRTANWNAEILSLGIATLFSSKDSLIKHLKAPSKLGLWSTYGCPIFETKGQLLIGLNAGLMDDSLGVLNTGQIGVGLRAYYGQNETKGFIQGESNFVKSQLPVFQAGIGLETTFAGSIWIDLSLNLKKTGSQPFVFTPGINISYGSPEKIN